MKNIYVVFAFHAHELLWDLPRTMLSYLEATLMKNSVLDGYIKKERRRQEYL